MPINYRNQAAIREKNPELSQALDDFAFYIENISNQANVSPHGATVSPPPPINKLTVTAAQGLHDIAIEDNNSNVVRGINYYVEYSTSPQFTAPTVIDLGASRNHRAFLGNQNLFFRAYSAYPTSKRSDPVYHGTENSPIPVVGGGPVQGPNPQPSNGSGTSTGASGSDGGFGNQPFRGEVRPTTWPKST